MIVDLQLQDLERSQVNDGYPALAAWIAHDPDGETLVFRRFSRLSARNLLHLQSQLILLEEKLDQLDREVFEGQDADLRLAAMRWETLVNDAEDLNRPDLKKRLELYTEIKVKIKEYHEALLLQAQIANLGRPSNRVYTIFRNWFDGVSRTDDIRYARAILSGGARHLLNNKADLLALRPQTDKDLLSQLLQNHWPLPGKAYPNSKDGTRHFPEKFVFWTVSIISVVLAAVLLVGAIVSLYFVKSHQAQLGLVACYTVLFAASVGLLTTAKRAEVFASTAAYAAVLVVFISGGIPTRG
ncbi:hypothetical protein GQ43DRAFT_385983 [Delitschia confertaspora ATCC 74209]|uniref:DUF6594 domain-containing protein n=1 Tax=Delitschia confertaspora ATCC 74209 TaxID=1513339 RepID=A0A9P4JXK1_9PLEO|nr:hypothetical protein GQ43DRAFT_385983 [Delitschia confertaspora ATCC 74209]